MHSTPAPYTVRADREVCIGAGICASAAPAIFDQDDDGFVVVTLDAYRDAAVRTTVSRLVTQCPSGAISIHTLDPSAIPDDPSATARPQDEQ